MGDTGFTRSHWRILKFYIKSSYCQTWIRIWLIYSNHEFFFNRLKKGYRNFDHSMIPIVCMLRIKHAFLIIFALVSHSFFQSINRQRFFWELSFLFYHIKLIRNSERKRTSERNMGVRGVIYDQISNYFFYLLEGKISSWEAFLFKSYSCTKDYFLLNF